MGVQSRARALARTITPGRARHGARREVGDEHWNAQSDGRPTRWPPEGHVVGPPAFIGVGGQRCGSSWWFSSICRHPDVYRLPEIGKEVRFLVRFHDHEPDAGEIAEYASWFPRPASDPSACTGEWTPYYMSYPWIGPVLHAVAPGAKVIASLRDPVERFLSGVALQDVRDARSPVATLRQVNFGFYAHQVAGLMATLPAEDLLVLQYEQCCADPVGQLARTYAFLGLEPFAVPEAELRRPAGRVLPDKPDLSPDRRKLLADAYAADVEQVFRLLPTFDPALWPNFR